MAGRIRRTSSKNKQVEIWPDNDAPGCKWLDMVLQSLKGKVKALKICRVESPYNDVADVVDAKGEFAKDAIEAIAKAADWIDRGIISDLLSAAEAYALYVKRAQLGEGFRR